MSLKVVHISAVLFHFGVVHPVFAQVDSTHIGRYSSFEHSFQADSVSLVTWQPSINDVQIFDPIIVSYGSRLNLGNTGTNSPWNIVNWTEEVGYRLGIRHAHLPEAGSGDYFFPLKAYTSVGYANGAANRENVLNIHFAKPLGNLLNFGFNYLRIGSGGAYNRQQTIINRLNTYAFYYSANRRYKAGLEFVYANDDSQDNGGLASDSIYLARADGDRRFIPVALNEASHKIVRFELLGSQRYSLYSRGVDSLKFKRLDPFVRHNFYFKDERFSYKDRPDTSAGSLYDNVWIDSLQTLDSLKFTQVRNDLSLGLRFVKSSVEQNVEVGVGHEWNRFWQFFVVDNSSNIFLTANYKLKIKRHELNAKLRYYLVGPNLGDTWFNGRYEMKSDSSLITGADFTLVNRRADRMMEHWRSNNFIWDNDFSREQVIEAKAFIRVPRIRLTADFGYLILTNLIFVGSNGLPVQATEVNSALVGQVSEHVRWRWINFKAHAMVNWFLTGDAIRLPPLAARGSLYYDGKIIKQKLRIQLGIDAWYNASYSPYGYVPALMRFNTQAEVTTPHYVSFDAFLNLEIKRFRGFFKVEHWNAGLMGHNYYMLAHYPMDGLSIKFGINWTFFD